jgi:hypothetical protein
MIPQQDGWDHMKEEDEEDQNRSVGLACPLIECCVEENGEESCEEAAPDVLVLEPFSMTHGSVSVMLTSSTSHVVLATGQHPVIKHYRNRPHENNRGRRSIAVSMADGPASSPFRPVALSTGSKGDSDSSQRRGPPSLLRQPVPALLNRSNFA